MSSIFTRTETNRRQQEVDTAEWIYREVGTAPPHPHTSPRQQFGSVGLKNRAQQVSSAAGDQAELHDGGKQETLKLLSHPLLLSINMTDNLESVTMVT